MSDFGNESDKWLSEKPENILHHVENGIDVLELPYPAGGAFRILLGAFLGVWLLGWFTALVTVVGKVLTGNANAFIAFWLVGWIFAGCAAMYLAFRLLHSGEPERFLLSSKSFEHDSGVRPVRFSFDFKSQFAVWTQMFARRRRTVVTEVMMASLTLREAAGENRFTVDHGSERIDLGRAATEVEREWLYKAIRERYLFAVRR